MECGLRRRDQIYAKIVQHVGVLRHRQFLIETDFDFGCNGNGRAQPSQEEDDDHNSHWFQQEERRIRVLE